MYDLAIHPCHRAQHGDKRLDRVLFAAGVRIFLF